MSFFIRSKL